MSVFAYADEKWLKPLLRLNSYLGEVESWSDMQDPLQSLMWIGIVQHKAGRDMFNSTLACDLATPPLDRSPMSLFDALHLSAGKSGLR